jgi:cobalt/nickel transport system ATP-binding protein
VAERGSILLIGHGSRSAAGVAECIDLVGTVTALAPDHDVAHGFIEFAEPGLDAALDQLAAPQPLDVVAVPLVLLGAGHLKDDGPAALARARTRHPATNFHYARDLGIHPLVLSVADDRAQAAVRSLGADPAETAVVVVGRGSTDPDANGDLYKVARLLWDGRGFGAVEPAFVSLAEPGVAAALDRCLRLGFRHVAVVPYFLFTGILVDRIADQVAAWAGAHPEMQAINGAHLGPDPRIARLVLDRYREALDGDTRMNCDCCIYRATLPGYEHRVSAPIPTSPPRR